jgi:hypothetical protein
MAQGRQRGWLKKEKRVQGETWMLYFRTRRKSDGARVENKIAIGLARDLPDKERAWAEVERLHLQINPMDLRRGVTFADLALHYAKHELGETESIMLGIARSRSEKRITLPPNRWNRITSFHLPSRRRSAASTSAAADVGV